MHLEPMGGTRRCPYCGGTSLIYTNGALVCTTCGTVVEESVVDLEPGYPEPPPTPKRTSMEERRAALRLRRPLSRAAKLIAKLVGLKPDEVHRVVPEDLYVLVSRHEELLAKLPEAARRLLRRDRIPIKVRLALLEFTVKYLAQGVYEYPSALSTKYGVEVSKLKRLIPRMARLLRCEAIAASPA